MSHELAAAAFTFDFERKDDVVTVRCHGRLVSGVNNTLYAAASKQIPGSKRIVLDLTDLSYMDSSGLGTLVRLYASCKTSGCALELIHLGPRIRQLLSVTNLLSVFTVIGEQGTMIRF
jgi:anti-sigma B factor antagonist